MGCIARLGCMVLLVVLAAGAWLTRGMWLPERFQDRPAARTAGATTWQPVSDSGAVRARAALSRLSEPRGPVFQSLTAGDLASLAFNEMTKHAAGAADSVAGRIQGDRISMRAVVNVAQLRGLADLGPLASLLGKREPVELTGTFHMVRPGLGELEVLDATVGRLDVPRAMIPRLVSEVSDGNRPAGLAPDALPLPLPAYVADIRIANGKVTLYKNVP